MTINYKLEIPSIEDKLVLRGTFAKLQRSPTGVPAVDVDAIQITDAKGKVIHELPTERLGLDHKHYIDLMKPFSRKADNGIKFELARVDTDVQDGKPLSSYKIGRVIGPILTRQ